MRFQIFAALGVAAVTLAGCAAPYGGMMGRQPAVTAPVPTTPTVLDAASREVARNVINREMQSRLPGANVAPYTDCVINNATTAEMIDIAQAAQSGVAGTANSVATIVSRPATTQCIAAAAQTTA
ncbi:hypothetical protein JJJ17_02920 [Paracoccus caeni]|uniref:Succinate dehydrogenase n=1 Tax=Paracoccus caeni TaxID=657651 RepID=A0A934SBG6_9RHOB|nr:hypothetical protein [Paracoccus caeni]MBK4214872.1 hypothetical protein [Paracoccus caeni]